MRNDKDIGLLEEQSRKLEDELMNMCFQMISLLEVIQVSFNIPPEVFWGKIKTEGLRLSTLRANNEK